MGTVEVICFPRDYEKYQQSLTDDAKVFIKGRVSAEEDKNAKVILEKVYPFDDVPSEVWIQFTNKAEYDAEIDKLLSMLRSSDGNDELVIYLKEEKAVKRMEKSHSLCADGRTLSIITEFLGEENVRVVEKSIANKGKM